MTTQELFTLFLYHYGTTVFKKIRRYLKPILRYNYKTSILLSTTPRMILYPFMVTQRATFRDIPAL